MSSVMKMTKYKTLQKVRLKSPRRMVQIVTITMMTIHLRILTRRATIKVLSNPTSIGSPQKDIRAEKVMVQIIIQNLTITPKRVVIIREMCRGSSHKLSSTSSKPSNRT